MKHPWLKSYDKAVPVSLSYPENCVHAFLQQAAKQYPQRDCTIYRDNTLSYSCINTLSDAFASHLLASGLGKGERVGLVLPNIPQFVVAYYGILKAGGVVVAMNPLYKSDEIQYHLDVSGAEVLVALDEYGEVMRAVQTRNPDLKMIFTAMDEAVLLDDLESYQFARDNRLLDILKNYSDSQISLPSVSMDDPAIFQFSGGTTGSPKAAVGLHRNLSANILQFSNWLSGLEAGKEVLLAAIPLYHVYGMVIGMGMAVGLGASMVLIDNARDINAILQGIDRYQATLFPGVPNLYRAINHHPDVLAGKYRLRSIKACISGSAPLLPETKAAFERLTGGKLLEGYGLSEAPTATHCNPMFGENRTGSIGLPICDVVCRIVDLETGKEDLPVSEAGELIIRGPQIMQGYYNQPGETRIALREGWLYTGDIARMDEDGYFYLLGRKKDLIKISGFQVWPREVEEVLVKHPAVKEACVAGVPDVERGEAVMAWVILLEEQKASSEELRAWCKERIAAYKCPSQIAFRRSFPRTTVGKLLRRELVREYVEAQ